MCMCKTGQWLKNKQNKQRKKDKIHKIPDAEVTLHQVQGTVNSITSLRAGIAQLLARDCLAPAR